MLLAGSVRHGRSCDTPREKQPLIAQAKPCAESARFGGSCGPDFHRVFAQGPRRLLARLLVPRTLTIVSPARTLTAMRFPNLAAARVTAAGFPLIGRRVFMLDARQGFHDGLLRLRVRFRIASAGSTFVELTHRA